jgi:hypothetical protein
MFNLARGRALVVFVKDFILFSVSNLRLRDQVLPLKVKEVLLLGVKEEGYQQFKLPHLSHDVYAVQLLKNLLLSLFIKFHFLLLERE